MCVVFVLTNLIFNYTFPCCLAGLRVGEDRKKFQAKQVWFGVRSDSQLLRLSPVRTPHQTSHTGIPEFGEFSGGSAGSTLADPPLSVGPAPRPPSRSCA